MMFMQVKLLNTRVVIALVTWVCDDHAAPADLSSAAGPVAIVVHKANAVNDLSSAELRKVLLGDETRWPGKDKITILLLPPGSEDRRVLLMGLLRMSDDDFTRHLDFARVPR